MNLIEQLDSISSLGDDWNANRAKSFSPELITKCKHIAVPLENCGFSVFPTGRDSTQFEKETDGEYIEIEVFDDHIEFYNGSTK